MDETDGAMVLSENLGQGKDASPSATTRPLAIKTNADPPRRPGSAAPPPNTTARTDQVSGSSNDDQDDLRVN